MNSVNSVKSLDKKFCTGCGVCANVCPNKCIIMKSDEEGFLYPSVNVCSGCGICVARCPVINPPNISDSQAEPQVYAAWSFDEETRRQSSSGGIFTELSKVVLKRGGFIAGAKYNEEHLVEHAIVEKVEDLQLLRESKYIQSETKNIYELVESKLKNDKLVLFVGTPCQCAGMSRYLKVDYDNLILCDFICHGVNSPLVYKKYLQELEDIFGAPVQSISFRDKTNGWNLFNVKINFENEGSYICNHKDDIFMYGFIRKGLNLYQRPSCEVCMFKGIKKLVDITLGDFWGIKPKDNPEYFDGVSAVMTHTLLGQDLLKEISSNIYLEKRPAKDVITGNSNLIEPAKSSSLRKEFWNMFKAKGFISTMLNIRNDANM